MKRPDWREWLRRKDECKKRYRYYLKRRMLRKSSLDAKLYFRKAIHNLDFTNWIYDKHKDEIPSTFGNERFFDWVIVGYYYSIYHAALCLIATRGLASKSHLATLNALIFHFYHEAKRLDKRDIELVAESIGKTLERGDIEIVVYVKSLRERASYNASYEFEESLVKTAKEDAVRFIEKVKSILEAG
jgi:uncharacterized protein (UPF0332 family)